MGLSSRRVATWHQSQPVLWLVVNAHVKLQTTTCGYCSTHPPIPHPFIPTCTHVYRLNLHSTSHTLNSLTQYLLTHPHSLPFFHCLKQVVGALHGRSSGESGAGLDVIRPCRIPREVVGWITVRWRNYRTHSFIWLLSAYLLKCIFAIKYQFRCGYC